MKTKHKILLVAIIPAIIILMVLDIGYGIQDVYGVRLMWIAMVLAVIPHFVLTFKKH